MSGRPTWTIAVTAGLVTVGVALFIFRPYINGYLNAVKYISAMSNLDRDAMHSIQLRIEEMEGQYREKHQVAFMWHLDRNKVTVDIYTRALAK